MTAHPGHIIPPSVFAVERVLDIRPAVGETAEREAGDMVYVTVTGGPVEHHSQEPSRPITLLFTAEHARELAWAVLSQPVA